MSSVGSFVAQVPKGGDYFLAVRAEGRFVTALPTSASTGYVNNVGSSYTFTSAANANTAIQTGAATAALAVGDTFRDMGKKAYIYVNSSTGGVAMLYAVINKVLRVDDAATAGGSIEGEGQEGWVVTYSAAPATTPISVVRTGRTNAGI
jgi:hypothetical protein